MDACSNLTSPNSCKHRLAFNLRLQHVKRPGPRNGECFVAKVSTEMGELSVPTKAPERSATAEKEETDIPTYPYGPPTPPKSWLFAGLGYGYGVGCATGPVFGIGVGIGPRGIQFGAGASIVGAFCGVGFAAGGILGQGSAYVPYGFNSSFFLAPRFVMLEQMAELYRLRSRRKNQTFPAAPSGAPVEPQSPHPQRPRKRAMDSMWPPVLRRWWHNTLNDFRGGKGVQKNAPQS
jgi:hypothetical protein